MNLYTIIIDFRGGKYIYQHEAADHNKALLIWAESLKPSDIQHIGEKVKTELIEEIKSDISENLITDIDTTINVRLCSLNLKTGFAMIHIIKTDCRK